jgi:hypothetical protein
MSLERRPIVEWRARRVLHEVRSDGFSPHRNLCKRRDSYPMGHPLQETADLNTAVPPELQMPLLDSGSLVAQPRVARVCRCQGQID